MCNIIVVLFNHSDHRHHRIYTMHKHFIYYAFTCMMQIQFLQWHCKRRISVRNHDIINLPRNRSRFSIFEFKNWIWVCTVCIRVPFEFRLFKWVTTSGFIWPFENRSWSKQWVRSLYSLMKVKILNGFMFSTNEKEVEWETAHLLYILSTYNKLLEKRFICFIT